MKMHKLGFVVGGALAAASAVTSQASAQPIACTYHPPGLIGVRPAGPCVYQGDRIVQQGPVYDGPAIVAPQPTYAPSATVGGYGVVGRRKAVRTVQYPWVNQSVVYVQGGPLGSSGPQVVRANAEVHIYSPERMDIRLYRR